MASISEELKKKYEILESKTGKKANVYKARDIALGWTVAIKEPDDKIKSDPKRLKKFIEEGKNLARLQHDNIIRVHHFYDAGELDENCYLIMEWMDLTLEALMTRERINPQAAIEILKKVLYGVRAVHNAGIIHWNIKPGNVYLSSDGSRVKIGDFGLATDIEGDVTLSIRSITPKYMAPEVFHENMEVDKRSDLYSVGMIAYEMLLGSERFRSEFEEIYLGDAGEDIQAMKWLNWHQDLSRTARPLKEVDPGMPVNVSDIVERMMKKMPAERYGEVDSALAAIEMVAPFQMAPVGMGGIVSPPPEGPATFWSQVVQELKKPKIYLPAVAGITVLLLLLGYFFFHVIPQNKARAAADAAGKAMSAAKAGAVEAGVTDEYESMRRAEDLRGKGNGSFSRDEFKDAERLFLEAKRFFEQAKNDLVTWMSKAEEAGKAAEHARERAAEFGREYVPDAFSQGELAAKEAAGLLEAKKYLPAANGFARAKAVFDRILMDKALIEMNMYKDKALQAGAGETMDSFRYGLDQEAKGVEAKGKEDFAGAEQFFVAASNRYEQTLKNMNKGAPLDMVFVEGGRVALGSTPQEIKAALELCRKYRPVCEPAWYEDERVRDTEIAPVFLDQYEVTNKEFLEFAEKTGYVTTAEEDGYSYLWNQGKWSRIEGANWRNPGGPGSNIEARENHPVVHMSHYDAAAYCKWRGKRLPTEVEWEWAARGPERLTFPWGNDFQEEGRANWRREPAAGLSPVTTAPVGSFPDGQSRQGVYDLAGSVWEWTGGGEDSGQNVLKGGSYDEPNPANLRGAVRRMASPAEHHADDGFRCAGDSRP